MPRLRRPKREVQGETKMNPNNISDSDLTKWAAEKFLAPEQYYHPAGSLYSHNICLVNGDGRNFDPIHDLNHLMLVVRSEKFPKDTLGIGIWGNDCRILKLHPNLATTRWNCLLSELGRKLLEILWKMEGSR